MVEISTILVPQGTFCSTHILHTRESRAFPSAAHFIALRDTAQPKYLAAMCLSHDLEFPCYQFNNSCSVPVQCNSNRRTPYGGIPSKDLSRKVVVSERVLTIRTSILH